MQSLPQEQTDSNPTSTSATQKLPDIEAEPDAQDKESADKETENKAAPPDDTTTTPEKSQTGRETDEAPAGTAVAPPVENEPGVPSQTEVVPKETDAKPDAPTESVLDGKKSPGSDVQKVKKQNKGVIDGRKYVPSKKAMVDPLKMDMSKPVVMPVTSSQLSLQCIECHIIFSDHKSKERHLKLSHPAEYEQCILRNALFACYVCDRHFTNSTELMVHQRAHTEKKPFKCPICGQAFKKSSELTAHKKVHFGQDGYACTDCGKPCKTLTLLKYHQRTHTGERPYVCRECGKRFPMSNTLQKHMVSHLPEGAQGDVAPTKPKVPRKKNDGAPGIKHPCSICKATFKTLKTRQQHMKNKHRPAAASNAPAGGLQLKQNTPIITPIAISQPLLLQVEPNGPLQKVDANVDTEQIRRLIESLGNVQKVNQVVILGQVPPHAPPLEVQQISEPAEMMNLNLSPPQIDFIGLKQAESETAVLDPSIDPMEQTIILEPITPDGQLENPSFSDLGSRLAAGEHVELTFVDTEQTEKPEGEVMHQILQQSENNPTQSDPVVCQNEADDLKGNLEQTIILELTPALTPTMELEQCQVEQQNEANSLSAVLNTDMEIPAQTVDQTAVDEQNTTLTEPSQMPRADLDLKNSHSDQKDVFACSITPLDTQVSGGSETTCTKVADMKKAGLEQVLKMNNKTQDQAEEDPSKKTMVKDKNFLSEVKDLSANEESPSKLQTPQDSELPINVMSAQELVKVRKRKPARTFFFQGYMHDLVGSIYKDDFQFEAKPAKRQRTKKSHLVVKFGPQSKDKKSKKQKKPTQEHQPVQENLIKGKSPAKKLSEKKVQTQKKRGKGKKEKTEGNVVTGVTVKSPSTEAPQVQQIKDDARKNKIKKQKVAKEGVAHISEHKNVASHLFKKKKQAKKLRNDQPKAAKTGKGKKNMAKDQVKKAEEPGSHVNQDSLLLLKGHKQPQLKVYKLDPSKASGQTPETSPSGPQAVSRTSESVEGKKKGGRSKKNQKALSLLSSLKVSHQPPETVPTKPKTTRKRKASSKVEAEGVITSKRALECKDCGEKFGEVSSLQKHKTTAHIIESPSLTYTNGNIFEGVSRLDLYRLPEEHDKVIRVMSAPTDWDTEPEMALEDRERSVSFPALNPSPSLPVPPQVVEMSTYEDRSGSKKGTDIHSPPSLEVQSPSDEINRKRTFPNFKPKTLFPAPIQTRSSETGEHLASEEDKQEDAAQNPISESDVQGATDEDVKDDLLLEVDLVTVGDQNEGDDAVSRGDSVNQNGSNQGCGSESGSPTSHSEQVGNKTPEKCFTSQTVSCSTHEVEVKEEEEETLVQKKKEAGTGVIMRNATRSHLKVDTISNTSSAGDDHRGMDSNNEQIECHVVYEKHPVYSNLEKSNCGIGTKTGNGLKATRAIPPVASLPCVSTTPEESPEEPVVFELESLSTSVDEVMNEGGLQGGEENDRECDQSPGNILERFLTSRRQAAADEMCLMTTRSDQRQALDSIAEVQVLRSQEIKIEENFSDPLRVITPTCQNLQSASVQPEQHRGIRSVLVKEESSSVPNDTEEAQGGKHTRWNLEPVRSGTSSIPLMETAETIRDCRVTPEFSSNQCIFYPVKEEEREVLLGSSQTSRGSSTPDGSISTNQAADCDAQERSSSVDYQETVVRGLLSEQGVGDYTDGQAASDSDWQHPSDIRDFLLQSSDEQDTSGFEVSEPQLDREVEILSYFNQNQTKGGHPSRTPANLPTSSSQPQEPSVENRMREPIDYFSRYFDWDTWVEIASCTNSPSNMANPVTTREVARFVGIHIAMGTLKFPSPRLYWEDLTKVLLISEAMPLTRFLELARLLKQTSPMEQHLTSQCESNNLNRSQTDPLWKVQSLLYRFNAGCRSLRQQGDYAVDQYPLPLTGKIHDIRPSLYCTTLTGLGGLLVHVDLKADLSDKEDAVEKMVPEGSTVFLCKQELSTPSMLERLLAAGVHGAGRVGGARGQIGDEFVSSDGKLMLRRSHCGFILSTAGKGQRNMVSLIDSFEKAQTLARLSRDLQSLYSIPLTTSAPTCWPQAVLWYLTDAALLNSWLLYRQDHRAPSAPLTFMAFRLEVSKALILSSGSDTQDSVPPQPPSEKARTTSETPGPILVEESPLPDASTRYDGSGHWPEQLGEGEGGRCRFGDCQRTSRVLCLKCCVFLCISRNHNCFLNFHNQGSSKKE